MFREAIEAAVKYKQSGEVDFVDQIMSELEVSCETMRWLSILVLISISLYLVISTLISEIAL